VHRGEHRKRKRWRKRSGRKVEEGEGEGEEGADQHELQRAYVLEKAVDDVRLITVPHSFKIYRSCVESQGNP
jgi:hypothetical protein